MHRGWEQQQMRGSPGGVMSPGHWPWRPLRRPLLPAPCAQSRLPAARPLLLLGCALCCAPAVAGLRAPPVRSSSKLRALAPHGRKVLQRSLQWHLAWDEKHLLSRLLCAHHHVH
ncbi:hypothetical protein NDU88_003970 [Pleurodeles waltl]|uniref:Uncharacterized protein n=1 Tax=Pleurodeles waltl TaxID=8319 RepID=A0AAV7W6X1_PLEWA|nr:hypothetical protein NDU88_003970 [Pleurodeles waltl]